MFYIRKALNLGPLRLNLSKSGVGMSFGAKGFRLGSGPKGSYMHAGRGGLYYRHFFGRGRTLPEDAAIPIETANLPPEPTDRPPDKYEIRERATVFCGILALIGFIALPLWAAPFVILVAALVFRKIVPSPPKALLVLLVALSAAPALGDDLETARKIRTADGYAARRVRQPTDESGRRIRMPGVEKAALVILMTPPLRAELDTARGCAAAETAPAACADHGCAAAETAPAACADHEVDLIVRCLKAGAAYPPKLEDLWCRFNYLVDAFVRAAEILEDATPTQR